ncbi:DNA alkylation repair protein [Bdellovibrio bacteriovorus]|uniref:DNA alkylation repair protein n=1 Tax=Bdellovibrio bacteriovorus TaxID=959 RepID=UPI0021D075A1|nr:DNA alkylation repair protein [Bdellovibrio bacteriovorus]UXR63980.1 DNA alkylation repair protein [Bdellovibrio bacteriovorus]
MPQKKSTENESAFKNWINEALVRRMAAHIQQHYPSFDSKAFIKVSHELPQLEMKPRMRLICDFLKAHLPADYPKALKLLLKATMKPKSGVEPLKGFDLWAFTEFVQRYGLEHFDESMNALHTLTQKFTAEFAVRPFIIHDQEKTLQQLMLWTQDPSEHVRRWVSEGTRPRLPWGELLRSFIKDPSPALALLEELKFDESLYVRKSVANHLNDITKDHPELVIKTLKRWLKNCPKEHKTKIDWITRHALRTQVKAGNPKALQLLGYHTDADVKLHDLTLAPKTVMTGEHLKLSFSLSSAKNATVVVDYAIHYKKSNGSHSAKVFKLSNKDLKAKERMDFTKKHSFRPVTTRVLYPGAHIVEIFVNGKSLGKASFILK